MTEAPAPPFGDGLGEGSGEGFPKAFGEGQGGLLTFPSLASEPPFNRCARATNPSPWTTTSPAHPSGSRTTTETGAGRVMDKTTKNGLLEDPRKRMSSYTPIDGGALSSQDQLIIALADRWYQASNARRDARRAQREADAACRVAAPLAPLLEQQKTAAQRLEAAWRDERLALDALAKLCKERAARCDAVDAALAVGAVGDPPTAQTSACTAQMSVVTPPVGFDQPRARAKNAGHS